MLAEPHGPANLAGALLRYRVMAWIVGIMLMLLCFVAIPLQYAANEPAMAGVVAPLHGLLYIVYLVAVGDMARRSRFSGRQLAGLVAAGLLPGLAFFVEARTTARLRAEKP